MTLDPTACGGDGGGGSSFHFEEFPNRVISEECLSLVPHRPKTGETTILIEIIKDANT